MHRGAEVSYHDPLVEEVAIAGANLKSVPLKRELLMTPTCHILVPQNASTG